MTKARSKVPANLKMRIDADPFSTPKTRGHRVKLLRRMTNMSRDAVADKYPFLNANTLKSWEIGREGGVTINGARRLLQMAKAEGIECSFDWLMYQIGDGPRVVNLNSSDSKENDKSFSASSEKKQIIDELRLFRFHHPNSLDYIVHDESMTPHFSPGDYVAGIAYAEHELAKIIEKICIIQFEDGSKLLRLIKNGTAPNKFNLFSLNLQTQSSQLVLLDQVIVCAAPVMWQRRSI